MAIKETPTNYRVYYKLMRERSNKRLNEAVENKEKLEEKAINIRNELESNYDKFKNEFNIDLHSYKEFNENKYINGDFYKDAKGIFMNRRGDYKLEVDLYNLYSYGNTLKGIDVLDKEIKHCNKLLAITLTQYNDLLKLYFTEVHKKIVLEGCGYAFGERIGWICANRVIVSNKGRSKNIDFKATKLREAELKAKGIRIWNKEEAEWCKANGIEYKAEDKRVYQNNEYYYEIPLINCRLTNGDDLKLTISDYRHTKFRGKTNEEIIKECNYDINKICTLPIDLKTKLTLCDKTDKVLYTKFIRNETQKSITFGKTDS